MLASATAVAAGVADPVSSMVLGTTPLPLNTTDPLAGPDATGTYAMFCVQLELADKAIGKAGQLPPAAATKPALGVIADTVIEAEPAFARVTICGALGTPTEEPGNVNAGREPERTR